MTRKYKPKRPQMGAVSVTESGNPSKAQEAMWRDFGPTLNKNAKGKIRELGAMVEAFKNFADNGITLPVNSIKNHHLLNPYFVEALRICGIFHSLGQCPAKLAEQFDAATTSKTDYQNSTWAVYVSQTGQLDSYQRKKLCDFAKYYTRKAKNFLPRI